MGTSESSTHKWAFRPRFRRHAFGWRSQTPIKRLKEAVSEIKKVGRKDKVLAAEGAVILLEKASPALEQVDSSSGAMGNAVNRAIDELAPLIAKAPAEEKQREKWLERLWQAIQEDHIPYVEYLQCYWGELCGSPERASEWADRLIGDVRWNWTDPSAEGRHFDGIIPCLSSLFAAGRYEELLELLDLAPFRFWPYHRWGVWALRALGRTGEALRYAENRGLNDPPLEIALECEALLLASGLRDEAYSRYAFEANAKSTYLATFRAIAKKYPHKDKSRIIRDLASQTPGREGKWFAAAKSAGLYEEAIELANASPCDPKTLTRAARDMEAQEPEFARQAGLTALSWMVEGYGYEISNFDVRAAYDHALAAAEQTGTRRETLERIREIVRAETMSDRFVTRVLGRELGLS